LLDAFDRGRTHGVLRADHLLHLRCEVAEEDILELVSRLQEWPELRFISLMDHTGQRQYTDMAVRIERQQAISDTTYAEVMALNDKRQRSQTEFADVNRTALALIAKCRGITLASHDDETVAHVRAVVDLDVSVAEFPNDAPRGPRPWYGDPHGGTQAVFES
jgi:alpha-D-ribose 1-methylphosphonate 5-triphosphate diphosphatase